MEQWYRESFEKDAEKITELLLSYINFDEDVVIDAVHSPREWDIISSKVKDAELIGIIAPEPIRNQRRKEGDKEKDGKRISHWHNVEGECLMSDIDWVFNGGATLEINDKLFSEFLEYKKNKEKIISGDCKIYTTNKVDRLNELVRENSILENKIGKAKEILKKFIKKKEKGDGR